MRNSLSMRSETSGSEEQEIKSQDNQKRPVDPDLEEVERIVDARCPAVAVPSEGKISGGDACLRLPAKGRPVTALCCQNPLAGDQGRIRQAFCWRGIRRRGRPALPQA